MSTDAAPSLLPCRVLKRISRGPVLVVLIILYGVFNVFILPGSVDESTSGPLDLKFSYSADTAYEMIASYGEDGRARYALSAMTADVAYPIVYTLMFGVWLTLALRSTGLSAARKCVLSISPIIVFVFDLIENAGIVALLKTYPDRHDGLVTLTSLATSAKWSAAAVVILLTIVATVFAGWRSISGRRGAT